ncbi:MAG: hypothetical protein HRT42_00150, partial [Campylobacteraceae bacterium]|nr:hypothetical protein [Campylobacteraceae bacterium]
MQSHEYVEANVKKQIARCFTALDVDKSGKITENEYNMAVDLLVVKGDKVAAKKIFSEADKDTPKDGVTLAELEAALLTDANDTKLK